MQKYSIYTVSQKAVQDSFCQNSVEFQHQAFFSEN